MTSEFDELDRELADLEDNQTDKPATRKRGGRTTLPIVVAAFALLSFMGVVFYAYYQGVRSGSEETAPLLTPDGIAKVQPDDPGGLEVPHQDKLVYNQVEPERDDSNVERLLPPPEDPMQPPIEEDAPVEKADTTPPIPSIINTPSVTKKAATPSPPASNLEAPTSSSPTKNAEPAAESMAEPKTKPAPEPETKVKKIVKAEPEAMVSKSLANSWRIQISAVKSDSAAKAEWENQQKKHGDLLANLDMDIQKVKKDDGTIFFRVRGGPLKDKKTAQALCDKLKVKKVACIIVKPDA